MNTRTELRLTDITRYEEVEEGLLLLTANGKSKSWNAIWQTNLRVGTSGYFSLPRGVVPMKFTHYHKWVDCPRLKLNHQNFMWIVPLDSSCWIDMGVNLYLCSRKGWPEPLPRNEFLNLISALLVYGITELLVEESVTIIKDSRFHPDNPLGLEDFWD